MKLKKITQTLILTILLMGTFILFGTNEKAYAYSFDIYSTSSISDYEGNEEYVHIPSYYLNKKISTVSSYTFYMCEELKGVTVPNTVTSIESSAFYGCQNLETIVIPSSVTYISDYAVVGSDNLTIYGSANSAAETFARMNNYTFKNISEVENKISFNTVSLQGVVGQRIDIRYSVTDNEAVKDIKLISFVGYSSAFTDTFDKSGYYSIIAYDGIYRAETIVTIIPAAPFDFSVVNDPDAESNDLTWSYSENYVSDYDDRYFHTTRFKIYRATSPNGPYSYLSDVSCDYSDFMMHYYDYDITYGITYYYKIETYVTIGFNTLTSSSLTSQGVCMTLGIPVITSIKAMKNRKITIEWTKVPNADGYYIYRSEGNSNNFVLVKTYIPTEYYSDIFSFENTGLKLGQTYHYKVCAFVTDNNVNIPITYSNIVYEVVRINPVKITKAVSKKPGTNTIYWKKNSDADGYIVYYSKKYAGKYKKLKTISNKKTLKYTHKKLKNGTAYYYKVVAYKKINGQKMEGIEHEPYMEYCDYYTHTNESYEDRVTRLFGNSKKTYYTSAAKARKNMKTIKIKVWDEKSNGKKFTRTFSVTVHKNLAPSVKKMFNEIYKSKERFPIHDIGAFSWRANNPTSIHCIGAAFDINANENYMIQDGKILSGSLWNPKKNKYSIPLNCKLVKILEKYGFYRGFWGSRKDYMHFSYFGT